MVEFQNSMELNGQLQILKNFMRLLLIMQVLYGVEIKWDYIGIMGLAGQLEILVQ